ncbi:probable asparagine--tRNA ligase, mitochondrial [Penaeus japonicus]|uniref:probable asparagine--tRNA ligase, mitochondrial n=1 Tax=Penaeus japonicus TaxID=27405 RepID=UPI001C710834|nr:probable asparagine--tRNA ligase, mitochondrial [Penaeus japonicus]
MLAMWRSWNSIRNYSSACGSYNVKSLLKSQPIKEKISVNGWVKGIRKQKELSFIDIDDGSSIHKLQVVIPTKKIPPGVGYHTSVSASGTLQASQHKGQKIELITDVLELIGGPQVENYPFKARKRHPQEYIRQFSHLRARTNTFSSIFRVRSQAKLAMQEYFNEEDFINIDTPILTANDCEGGGEVFLVQPLFADGSSQKSLSTKYFGHPAYLTVSGQLHLEAMASGLSKVYNFNPAFRAENSQTRRHLAEFWMVEAEEAFLSGPEGLQKLMNRIEDLLKSSLQRVLDNNEEDVLIHWKQNEHAEELVKTALSQPFIHMTYQEAMALLQENSQHFQTKPSLGDDLGKEHELFLTHHAGNRPLFVTDWPKKTKAFYMRTRDDNSDVALGVDLLLPGIGEVAGGGLREDRPLILHKELEARGLVENLQWYLDLRTFGGGAPSGGFGVGFERFLQFILGISNIKDAIPYPRWAKHCSC